MTNQIDPRLIQMQQVLLQTISDKYQALVETINKIPMQQDFKVSAITNINQGFLWAKEGIPTVNFNFEPPTPSEPTSAEVPPVIPEESKAGNQTV